MKPLYRRLLILSAAIVVLVVAYFGYRFYEASLRAVPQEFSQARSEGAAVSEKIVSGSNDIALLVGRLSSTTSTPLKVSSTIGEMEIKVDEVRAQAVELATTLESMTRAVQGIGSEEAQQAALEAISKRLELVNRLIAYTDDVSRLTLAMRLRLENGIKNSKDIAALLKTINSEVAAVNDLSRKADEAMAKFDSLLR